MKKLFFLLLIMGMSICYSSLKSDSYIVNNSNQNIVIGIAIDIASKPTGRFNGPYIHHPLVPGQTAILSKNFTARLNKYYSIETGLIIRGVVINPNADYTQVAAGPIPYLDNVIYSYSGDGKLTFKDVETPPMVKQEPWWEEKGWWDVKDLELLKH
ncbi:MAG: hypothetical protein WCE21_00690 [Candidatus Babeliales bacterium]